MKHGHWNHRVVRREWPKAAASERVSYAIHEAHYKYRQRKPYAITITEVAPHGETVEELRESLQMMLKACELPVLDFKTREEI